MRDRSFMPQYCEKNTLLPDEKPKKNRNIRNDHCPAMPTAESETSPSWPTMMVSIRLAEEESRFCAAMGRPSVSTLR